MTSPDLRDEKDTRHQQGCPKRWILAFALCFMRLCHATLRQDIGIALVCMTRTTDDVREGGANMTRGNVTVCEHAHNATGTVDNLEV